MAGLRFFSFVLITILCSCAQVGSLSGGEKDENAPKPIHTKTQPANETIRFSGTTVSFEFDEFIQLNNPQQTIQLVPNHARPNASLSKKTLTISWTEQLQANTTYVLYLDGTVKDVTEGNDTLIKYVFSTGSAIDSLSYSVQLKDAFSNQPKENCIVGLYESLDSLTPIYFARTNKQGLAKFDYLKAGSYYLIGFQDDTRDLKLQANEAQGFRLEPVEINDSTNDTIPLLISSPLAKRKIQNVKYAAPGSVFITSNYDLSNKTFQIEDQVYSKEAIVFHSLDSVQLFYTPRTEQTAIKAIVSGEGEVDTLSARITERDRKALLRFSTVFNNNEIGPHEQFAFKTTSKLQSLDTSKIHLLTTTDSTKIPFTALIESNKLIVNFDQTKIKEVKITMDKGAATSTNGQETEAMATSVKVKTIKDYGVVHVDASAFTQPIIVELLQNGKVVSKALLISDFHTSFEYLTPGEYQFRVIEDANQNFVWDPIQPIAHQQAEKVYFYTTISKVRANWEIDVKLTPLN
jgi:uncharacterized protein (DUF2141 family)